MLPAFHWDHECRFVLTREGDLLPRGHETRELPMTSSIGFMESEVWGDEVGFKMTGNSAELLHKFVRRFDIETSGLTCVDEVRTDAECRFAFNTYGQLIEERESILGDLRGRKSTNLKKLVHASAELNFDQIDAVRSKLKIDFDRGLLELKLQPRGEKSYLFGSQSLKLVAAYQQACGVRVYVARQDDRPADGALSEVTVIDRTRFYDYCQPIFPVVPVTVNTHVVTAGMAMEVERFTATFDAFPMH